MNEPHPPADYIALLASIERDLAGRDWLREQRRWSPWQVVATSMAAGASFFAATFALSTLFITVLIGR